jgi:NAD-dependent deacetylase
MDREMDKPRIDGETRLLVLTGAGVSAESGIPTFRGSGGLWQNHAFERLASPEGFQEDPDLVWRFYSWRRTVASQCRPNPGHLALAKVEERLGERFLLVTQNVDGLHRQAGSRRLREIHGNLFLTRCASCDRPPFEDKALHERGAPRCDRCGGLLRPHVVWFGEMLDPSHFEEIDTFLERARGGRLLFLAAGTSGVVYPAAGLVDLARRHHAETWLVNAEAPENAHRFHQFIQGKSGEVLPELLAGG